MRQILCRLGPWVLVLGMGCQSEESDDSFSFLPQGHSQCSAGGVAFTTGGQTRFLCADEAPGGDGSNGSNGSDGQTGTSGVDGAEGSTGSEGQVGQPGPMGIQGPTGSMGPAGPMGADADAILTNGTRIELRRTSWDGDDGTYFQNPWLSYYDTDLGVACSVLKASDGTLRCMPIPDAHASGYYSDAACTSRLAYASASACTTLTFVSVNVLTACGPTSYSTRSYRVGSEYTGSVYSLTGGVDGGTCYAIDRPAGAHPLFSMGAEITPSQMVEFTESTDSL